MPDCEFAINSQVNCPSLAVLRHFVLNPTTEALAVFKSLSIYGLKEAGHYGSTVAHSPATVNNERSDNESQPETIIYEMRREKPKKHKQC